MVVIRVELELERYVTYHSNGLKKYFQPIIFWGAHLHHRHRMSNKTRKLFRNDTILQAWLVPALETALEIEVKQNMKNV